MEYQRLGDYIRPVDVRNRDLKVNLSQGICNAKYFQNPKQVADNPETHKVVRTGQFAYNRATTRNGDKISIALREGPDCTVSSAYQVFEIVDENQLDPKYLMMWFKRPEFDRLAIFYSHGSAHEFFEWDAMCEVRLPIPSIARQREIVEEYETLSRRIRLNEKMIVRLEETAQALYRKMFVDGIDKENLPEGWRRRTIGEFCDIITGKKDVNESLNEGKYRFFSCSPDPYYSNEFIAKGPVALIAGNGSYTGRVTYYDKEFDLYQRTYACLPKKDYVDLLSYLYCVLKFEFQTKYMGGSRGSSIPYIVRGDISDFELVFNNDKCKSFSNDIGKLLSYIQLIIKENEKLTELQSLLLARMGK